MPKKPHFKTWIPTFAGMTLMLLTGCSKNFQGFLEQARQSYADKNYINTVDSLNVGLLHWKESDGTENKAEAYQLLGQSYHSLRNTDKAAESYSEAVKLSTQTFPAAYALGMIYLTKNQIPAAIDAFQKALQMKPDDPMSLLGLGNCYYALRKYKDAQFTYQRVIDVSPGVKDALDSLALARSRAGRAAKAAPTKTDPGYKSPVKQSEKNAVLKKKPKKK